MKRGYLSSFSEAIIIVTWKSADCSLDKNGMKKYRIERTES
jgi:hypothetical protein